MLLAVKAGVKQLEADRYRLRFASDKPFVYLDDHQGKRMAELFVYSSVHPMHTRDDTTNAGDWEVMESEGEVIFSLQATSSAWRRKTYRLRCRPNRLVYEVEVEGSGQLAEVNYFGGYSSAHARWGSGFYWSGQNFTKGFNPTPNSDEINYFSASEGSQIELMGVPLPVKSTWFFTPPPFCLCFSGKHGWLGLGVEAEPGVNRFTRYAYHGQRRGFFLSLAFEGHTFVKDFYRLPGIGIDFAGDEYQALDAHIHALQEAGWVPAARKTHKPPWWREPIFCGWGQQCYQAEVEKGKATEYSKQDLYDSFLATLSKQGLEPGTIVLDDKWQATYGQNQADERKWPDLRRFIDQQHALGKKVLLWLKAWDPEGLPVEECITNSAGLPLSVDPTNPAYEARLRESIRGMLSADGYDADGFKIDFTARMPSGPGICLYGDAWGLELMKLYLGIIYEEAKRTKRDALVMTQTPHPYLADVTDMIRLNDINTKSDINRAMQLRSRIARLACPEAIIDTDNWPMRDLAAWRRYLRLQGQLGVPSLYYATHIDSTREPLTPKDYDLVKRVWRAYRAGLSYPESQDEPLDRLGQQLHKMRSSLKSSRRRGMKALGLK
jgi:hypothetical protein